MKIWHLLLSILLLTTLAWSEATISQLTSLFHEGNYEKLVVEGELLGKKLQQAGDKQGVAQVYQMLTIAYMRLGRQDDMRRCNAIAKGKFSEMNQSSGDPVARERAIAQKASSLYSSGDLEATVAYVDQQLANWPADSPRRYWVFKPKFHALWEFRDREQALQALNQETSALENVLANDPHNSKFYRANLGLTYLLGSASLAYTEPERSRQLGLKAQEHLLGPQGCGVEWLSGGPNLPFRIAAAAGRYQDAIQLSDQYLGTVYNFQTFYHSAAKARKAYWLEQLGRDREAHAAQFGDHVFGAVEYLCPQPSAKGLRLVDDRPQPQLHQLSAAGGLAGARPGRLGLAGGSTVGVWLAGEPGTPRDLASPLDPTWPH